MNILTTYPDILHCVLINCNITTINSYICTHHTSSTLSQNEYFWDCKVQHAISNGINDMNEYLIDACKSRSWRIIDSLMRTGIVDVLSDIDRITPSYHMESHNIASSHPLIYDIVGEAPHSVIYVLNKVEFSKLITCDNDEYNKYDTYCLTGNLVLDTLIHIGTPSCNIDLIKWLIPKISFPKEIMYHFHTFDEILCLNILDKIPLEQFIQFDSGMLSKSDIVNFNIIDKFVTNDLSSLDAIYFHLTFLNIRKNVIKYLLKQMTIEDVRILCYRSITNNHYSRLGIIIDSNVLSVDIINEIIIETSRNPNMTVTQLVHSLNNFNYLTDLSLLKLAIDHKQGDLIREISEYVNIDYDLWEQIAPYIFLDTPFT